MTTQQQQPLEKFDVVVIGGGAAVSTPASPWDGRGAVVVIDSGEPRNAPADGVHMFLTRDGIPPADLSASAVRRSSTYGGRFIDGTARHREPSGEASPSPWTTVGRSPPGG